MHEILDDVGLLAGRVRQDDGPLAPLVFAGLGHPAVAHHGPLRARDLHRRCAHLSEVAARHEDAVPLADPDCRSRAEGEAAAHEGAGFALPHAHQIPGRSPELDPDQAQRSPPGRAAADVEQGGRRGHGQIPRRTAAIREPDPEASGAQRPFAGGVQLARQFGQEPARAGSDAGLPRHADAPAPAVRAENAAGPAGAIVGPDVEDGACQPLPRGVRQPPDPAQAQRQPVRRRLDMLDMEEPAAARMAGVPVRIPGSGQHLVAVEQRDPLRAGAGEGMHAIRLALPAAPRGVPPQHDPGGGGGRVDDRTRQRSQILRTEGKPFGDKVLALGQDHARLALRLLLLPEFADGPLCSGQRSERPVAALRPGPEA